MTRYSPVVIVGSGLAGISLALRLSNLGVKSLLLTKSTLASGSSLWAQGGIAAAMDPGSTAGVLIWENLWASPFASAARRAGGQLIPNGRIPIQAIIASIEADIDTIDEGA